MISPALVSRLQLGLIVRARSRRCPTRHGLTVIELLAATIISLIVMGATVQLFGTVGNQISNGRSNIELGDRIRSTVERLRKDLRGITVDMRTWNRPEDASGYFEIIKGPTATWDKSQIAASGAPQSATNGAPLAGYTADGIFFTTRSRDLPFVGRAQSTTGNVTLESQVAEVAWYLQPTTLTPANGTATQTTPPTFTLYRRQFLVLPGVGASVATGTPPSIPVKSYYDSSYAVGAVPLDDISARPDGSGNMVLNSLADLAYRENRFAHFSASAATSASNPWGVTSFGFPIVPAAVKPFPSNSSDPNQRYGEDVVLTNVLSFDVKVWDPGAPVVKDPQSGAPLVPSDIGYSTGMTPIAYGAYVDLNWANGATITNPSGVPGPYFSGSYYGSGQKSYIPTTIAGLTSPQTFPQNGSFTYDTWSYGYESWLYSPSGTPATSTKSFNGFDDTGSGGVDSPSERLTSPPYPVPLRGIQIKIRTYEFTSRQVREVTIQENFVPD